METVARRLTRSQSNRVFAGVCAGLAQYLGWDVALVRVAYVVLTLLSFGAGGVLLYLFAWMLIPLDSGAPADTTISRASRASARTTVGVLLLILGAMALFDSFMPWFWHIFNLHVTASLILIAIGLVVIFWKHADQVSTPVPATGTPPTAGSDVGTQEPVAARRLTRLDRGRKIAGVCAGVAKYFGLDPTIVRLVFLALVFVGGGGLILYLVLWLVMPLETA